MRQLKKLLILLLVMAISVSLGVVGCAPAPTPVPAPAPTPAPAPAAPEFYWRFQCPYPEADLDYAVTTKGVAALIEKASDGQVKVDTYPAGALVADEEILSAVIDGAIEIAMNMTGAQGEIIPTGYCTGLIGSAETLGEYYDLNYRTGLLDIVREDFREHGLYLIGTTLPGPACLRASFRLDSWDALKGRKGWANPADTNVLTQLGGICVDVPGYDMYSAMKLGTIEWHEWSVAELETLGWKEVTKSFVLQPILKPASNDIFVNLKAWEALGPELQKKIEDAVIHGLVDLGLEYRDTNAKALIAAEEYGVEMIRMSPADCARFKDLCVKDWDSIATISPRCAECIEIAKEWLKKKELVGPM